MDKGFPKRRRIRMAGKNRFTRRNKLKDPECRVNAAGTWPLRHHAHRMPAKGIATPGYAQTWCKIG
jgi:hypothetical protein